MSESSDDVVIVGHTVIDGVVHLDGAPVLDAKGDRLRHRPTCSVMCQLCKQNTVEAPLQVMMRFEPALGRRMYWQGIALSWEALGALRCEKCRPAHDATSTQSEDGPGQPDLL